MLQQNVDAIRFEHEAIMVIWLWFKRVVQRMLAIKVSL